jgi:DNA adenine methylase
VLGPSVTERLGITGILLDPPYDGDEHDIRYRIGAIDLSADVRAWALANGENPLLRIALCGYEGEHEMPSTWECVAWKAQGGYGSTRKSGENVNARRERIWFSPACQRVSLFSEVPA